MSVSLESSDGLLRHVLVGGFLTSSPVRHHGNESAQQSEHDSNHRLKTTGLKQSTPSETSNFSPVFCLPTFSPLNLSHKPSPVSSSPSKSGGGDWIPQRKHSLSRSSFSSPFSSPRRRARAMSPVLDLANIDETQVLNTPMLKKASLTETSNRAMNANTPIPNTVITAATPPVDATNSPEAHHSCHSTNHFSSLTDLENLSLRLRSLSVSPVLGRSPGPIAAHEDGGVHKRYLRFKRSDITFGKQIGKGGFGCVHQGSIAGSPVAVKIVQKRRGSGIHREILQAERLAFKLNLRHENIVGIYGFNLCEELRGDALILMELVTSQSLQVLIDDTTSDIEARHRLEYALQVAKGLQYLHKNNVAHLDVKPSNVLMTSEHVCKLSDFGNLTLTGPNVQHEEAGFTQLLGTLPYRAPELMKGLFPSTKADIYSFGVTLWQMQTRESPHQGVNPHYLIYQVVHNDIRPAIPDTGNDVIESSYKDMYTSCWSKDPHSRPDSDDVINTIQDAINTIQDIVHHIPS